MRRCGYCRGAGHNRQTCPSLTKQNSSQINENTKTASGRRSASCGYCRSYLFKIDRTHTRSTCLERKKARDEWIEENSSWAFKFKQDMMKLGMGIGALVEYGGEDKVFEVVKINFEDLSRASSYGYSCRDLTVQDEVSRYWQTSVPYPSEEPNNICWESRVVSPIPAEMVAKQFPSDWEYGIYGVPHYLQDTKRRKSRKRSR